MDSTYLRLISKPAYRGDLKLFNELTKSQRLPKSDSELGEQHVSGARNDQDHTATSDPELPVDEKLQVEFPAGDSPEHSEPVIYTPVSDTEYESVVEQSPDRPRKPRKVYSPRSASPESVVMNSYIPGKFNLNAYSKYSDSDDEYDYTMSEIRRLKAKIQDLDVRRRLETSREANQQPHSEHSRYQILHRLGAQAWPEDKIHANFSDEYTSSSESEAQDWRGKNGYIYPDIKGSRTRFLNIFTDPPVLTDKDGASASLHCNSRVGGLKYYLKSNPDISFVIFYDYRVEQNCYNTNGKAVNPPMPYARSVYPVSRELKTALSMVLEDKDEYSRMLNKFRDINEVSAPFLFIYHSRQEIPMIKEKLSKPAQNQLDLFLEYVMNEFGNEYNTVDALLERKEILPQYLHYLIKKGDILVKRKNGEYQGYRAESWLYERIPTMPPDRLTRTRYDMPGNEGELRRLSGSYTWNLNAFTYGFDGKFFGRWKVLKIEMCRGSDLRAATEGETESTQSQGQSITDLDVFPLRHAPDHVREMLYRRGDILWNCRMRQLVSYQANRKSSVGIEMVDRYMIDMETYQSVSFRRRGHINPINTWNRPRLSSKTMGQNDTPGDNFKVLMPPKIKGYNFYQQKWCDLRVDEISDVVWSSEAFRTLEIDYEAKDLIQALVTNYLEMKDLTGPSQGFTILLHGDPGTGKSHTAESIAELVKKPLYRVNCSDLGTRPEKVEGDLEREIHLARIWDCVLLLDEADIFIERTSLGDLQRNTLTAIFLRTIRSYDGIVVLKSSRVSTFNEAIKSQTQLALHFPALTSLQRYFIWKSFIHQLELANEDADISDLYEHAGMFGQENLNGTQIRTIFTNACRYARWKKVPLNHHHIKHMMELLGRHRTFFEDRDSSSMQDELAFDEWLHRV